MRKKEKEKKKKEKKTTSWQTMTKAGNSMTELRFLSEKKNVELFFIYFFCIFQLLFVSWGIIWSF